MNPDFMITCGWCGTHSIDWTSQCKACGGRMPAPAGMELGEPPPAVPRDLPKGFEFRQQWSHNVVALVGGVFLLIGTLLFLVFIIVLPVGALLPLLFMVGGAFMLRIGRKKANGVLNAFRLGVAVEGSVSGVQLDTSQTLNGRHPWVMTYLFKVGSELVEGSITSFSSALETRSKSQPVWVLYDQGDPTHNTIYPPM
ncbi:MAG: hypothetical protein RL693_1883 [Verrucomicrobiota bacterium]|jgi:hypothetical protein